MDPIDLLEKRIEALELQVLPKEKSSLESKFQGITDILLQTQTMISSALSCRDAITSILRHIQTVNEYLDPCYGENDLEVEAKRHYLLELYPEVSTKGSICICFLQLGLTFANFFSVKRHCPIYRNFSKPAPLHQFGEYHESDGTFW